MKKGEFEKVSVWQARVNETSRQEKIAELTKAAEQAYIESTTAILQNYVVLGDYCAENEVFMILVLATCCPGSAGRSTSIQSSMEFGQDDLQIRYYQR